ncbi:MAG TPA: alpha/beta hydrolase [Acidobacteriota bacterium]|jgi:hypothetical protein
MSARRNLSLIVLLLATAGVVWVVMSLEDKFIYFPIRYPEGDWEAVNLQPAVGGIGPKIDDCWFRTADGVKLHAWHCSPQKNLGGTVTTIPAEMTLMWFHGNGGNISHRYDMIRLLMHLPVNVFIFDYRGYGRSEGAPSEAGLYLDAHAAWEYLTRERKINPLKIVLLGKSLGGVPAIELATHVEPAGLIVQSSFTSVADMGALVLPFIPGFLIRSRMDSLSRIRSVKCPKLFIHSPADEIVPFRLGRALYEAASQPKQFYEVANAPHNETYAVGGEEYLGVLREFISVCNAAQKEERAGK